MEIYKKAMSLSGIILLLCIALACKSLTGSTNTTAPANTAPQTANSAGNTKTDSDTKSSAPANTEKADFTMTSEDLDKEFTR
jgi:hypothetical protein